MNVAKQLRRPDLEDRPVPDFFRLAFRLGLRQPVAVDEGAVAAAHVGQEVPVVFV